MVTVFASRKGQRTIRADAVDPAWLRPDSETVVWVNLHQPTPVEASLLRDVFKFHELAIEDALSEIHHPKVEAYDGYIYLILHGIDFEESEHHFATLDVDFFLGSNYLVTVQTGPSRSIDRIGELCARNDLLLAEGPGALLHRIVDQMVDHYRPEVEALSDILDKVEEDVFERPSQELFHRVLALKRDVASLRRVVLPERDVVGQLARRDFPLIDTQLAYRFRDIHDHLVRIADEAMFFQDRLTGLLDAHLSNVSYRLNEVMKVLTVISVIFMPMTVIVGVYGMNVRLPHLPGGEAAQFWWIVGFMVALAAVMMWCFRRVRWL